MIPEGLDFEMAGCLYVTTSTDDQERDRRPPVFPRYRQRGGGATRGPDGEIILKSRPTPQCEWSTANPRTALCQRDDCAFVAHECPDKEWIIAHAHACEIRSCLWRD